MHVLYQHFAALYVSMDDCLLYMYVSWLIPKCLRAKQSPSSRNEPIDDIAQVDQGLVLCHTVQGAQIRRLGNVRGDGVG
jgi:hypothetical protein